MMLNYALRQTMCKFILKTPHRHIHNIKNFKQTVSYN